jgi:hypothetical protein
MCNTIHCAFHAFFTTLDGAIDFTVEHVLHTIGRQMELVSHLHITTVLFGEFGMLLFVVRRLDDEAIGLMEQ